MNLSNNMSDPLVINAEIFKTLLEIGLPDDSGKFVPFDRVFLRLLYQRVYAHGYLKQKTDYYIVISARSLLMTLNLRRKARSPICCGHRPQKHLVQDRKRALFSQNVDDRSALSNLPVLACVSIHQLKIAGTAV